MQSSNLSSDKLTEKLDYLQRTGLVPGALAANTPSLDVAPHLRRLIRIEGIGRLEKATVAGIGNGRSSDKQQVIRLLSEDILSGIYGYKIPLAFLIQSDYGNLAVHMGTWSSTEPQNGPIGSLDDKQNIIKTVLNSLYPTVKFGPAQVQLSRFPLCGLGMGIPTAKSVDTLDNALQIDRLIRALIDTQWAFLLLAKPVEEHRSSKLRNDVINEIRMVQSAYSVSATSNALRPLAQHYVELLQQVLATLTQGQSVGLWRTGIYLMGDAISYPRLASTWRGIFSGEKSILEPVRVWDSPGGTQFAEKWAMLNLSEVPGLPSTLGSPGPYQHQYQYQTLLTSSQLAVYVQLPQLETSGFSVTIVPDFDTVPPLTPTGATLSLGNVIPQGRVISVQGSVVGNIDHRSYRISMADLTKHTFIAGITGTGKTNTAFHILKEVNQASIPFLVIEPAKAEYRTLRNDPQLASVLQIFTLGNENVAPFRMNPFEVVSWPTIPISVHLDLLRSVFSASFGMWTPLPQVLEQSLHRIYEERGWDIASNTNPRLSSISDVAQAFPTLSDLITTINEVTRCLGYEERITSDIQASLSTRIDGLRAGGKGQMLDVQHSFPMKMLLEKATVLELESMGDDDDKAFIMGLLLIRLIEYRQAEHRRGGSKINTLRHVLVIEEAHRLLANVGEQGREEEANPRGKAVETFSNLLSEIRAYGQGIIVADQVPVKLAPDVIKNTNLKIIHKIVAADDRKVLAGAMVMNERQSDALARLQTGQAVVFSEHDDAPVLIEVEPMKDHLAKKLLEDTEIANAMKSMMAQQGCQSLFFTFPICVQACSLTKTACQEARRIVEDRAFQAVFARVILSTIEDTDAFGRLWRDVFVVIQAKRSPKSKLKELLSCLSVRASHWYAQRRGMQAGWSYAETEGFADKLQKMIQSYLKDPKSEPARKEFQQCACQLYKREYSPFLSCSEICKQQPPLCLYRYSVGDIVAVGKYNAAWHNAITNDVQAKDDHYKGTWSVCQDAACDLIEWIDDTPGSKQQRVAEAAKRVSLCFAQQMLIADNEKMPKVSRKILEQLRNGVK